MTDHDVAYWLAQRMERVEGVEPRFGADADDIIDHAIQLALDGPEDQIVAEVLTGAETVADADGAKVAHAIADRMVQAWNDAEILRRYREAVSCSLGEEGPPTCPKCGGTNGGLGTSAAYFICHDCGGEQYWTKDHQHPNDWDVAMKASPWGRRSELVAGLERKLDSQEQHIKEGERFRSFLIDIARKMGLLGTTIADLPAAVAFERTEMIEVVAEQYLDALHVRQKPDRDSIVSRAPVTISEDLRKRLALVELLQKGAEKPPRPEIVCLCGSSRFVQEMAILGWELEKEGKIILGLHLLPPSYVGVAPDHQAEAEGVKDQMDELHLRKIDLADRVLVVNIGGYIGNSTQREIGYATAAGKPVAYLEPEPCPVEDCDEPRDHV